MPKFKAAFRGVPNGEIYPVDYQPGDECPPELVDAAKSVDVLGAKGSRSSAAAPSTSTSDSDAEERTALFAELDKVGAAYDKEAATAELLVVLEDAKKKAESQ